MRLEGEIDDVHLIEEVLGMCLIRVFFGLVANLVDLVWLVANLVELVWFGSQPC